MPNTGFTLAGVGTETVRSNTGIGGWMNTSRIVAEDESHANTTDGTEHNNWLTGYDFGNAVSTDAQITGIVMRIQMLVQGGSGTISHSFQIGKSSASMSASKTFDNAINETPKNYDAGSSSDTWGLSLSASDINSSDFRAQVFGDIISGTFTDRNILADAMWLNVYYTEAASTLKHHVTIY